MNAPIKALGNLLSARPKNLNPFTMKWSEFVALSKEDKEEVNRRMMDAWSGGSWSRMQRETQADHQDALRDREDWSRR